MITGSLNETYLLVILKGLNNIILWCGNKQVCTLKPPYIDICVAIWFTLTTPDVITKCWISFLNDNWIYQLFHIAPFKAVPSQLDTMSPANVLLSKAFANILHADLCKCNLQMFFIIADIMKSPSFSANLTCGERKKSHRMLILEVHTVPILTE